MDSERDQVRGQGERQRDDPPEVLGDDGHVRADALLIRRAMTEGWPVTDEMKARLVERAGAWAENAKTCRDFVRVAHVFVAMEQQNLETKAVREHRDQQDAEQIREHLVQIVVREPDRGDAGPGAVPPEPA